MDRRFVGILVALVVIFVAIFAITQHGSGNNNGSSSGTPTNHIEGSGSTGVKLIEYGDYECPVCGEYYPVMKQVEAKYANQIYFQFRNLPLTEIHPNAFAGARAAEAAGLQNKYWQMHDLLYANQDIWATASDPTTYFDQYAQQLGLNVAQFKSDYSSDQVNNAINADLAAFDKTGQQKATPTFFLDGKVLDDAKLGVPSTTDPAQLNVSASVANFSKLIDAEIAAKTHH